MWTFKITLISIRDDQETQTELIVETFNGQFWSYILRRGRSLITAKSAQDYFKQFDLFDEIFCLSVSGQNEPFQKAIQGLPGVELCLLDFDLSQYNKSTDAFFQKLPTITPSYGIFPSFINNFIKNQTQFEMKINPIIQHTIVGDQSQNQLV